MDFQFVTNRLATGATIPDISGVEILIKAGITHIINCQAEHCDLPLIKDTNLKYLHLPTNDDNSKKGIDWFGPGIEFALNALVLPKNKIYIHCQAGINRAPSMTFAILLAQGIDSINARRLIKEVRPEVGLLYRYDAEKAVKLLEYV